VLSLVFPIGSELYALALEQVREIVPAPALTILPTAPATVMGLLNLRGNVLPVLDAGMLLGSPFAADPQYVMVVGAVGSPIGLTTSGLPRIVDLERAPGGAPDVHTDGGDPVVLIDAGALVRRAYAEG
jgi:purine-binding chemotaxis protein CheW